MVKLKKTPKRFGRILFKRNKQRKFSYSAPIDNKLDTKAGKQKRETFKFKNYKIQDLRDEVLRLQMVLSVELRNGVSAGDTSKLINKILRSEQARAYAVYLTISKRGFRSKGFSKKKPTTNIEYRQLMSQMWYII